MFAVQFLVTKEETWPTDYDSSHDLRPRTAPISARISWIGTELAFLLMYFLSNIMFLYMNCHTPKQLSLHSSVVPGMIEQIFHLKKSPDLIRPMI
jgi:hypothetical protein